ncbi:MAG: hypothetical protein CMN60_20125 [Sphingobium sp.]|nr:hypothetical protein [Sphingobium sp.]|tara:strand:+ start:6512 stop:7030 length:519 start_codon:yes stop_codon:yes gene_type:complete
MTSAAEFEQNLQIGQQFETEVAEKVIRSVLSPDGYIIPTHNWQVDQGNNRGPRILLPSGGKVTLPDFFVIDPVNGTKTLIEAKYKKKAAYVNGHDGYCVEQYKCWDYQRAARLMDASLLFLIGDGTTQEVLLYDPSETDTYTTHTFNNKFTKFKPVDNWVFLKHKGTKVDIK